MPMMEGLPVATPEKFIALIVLLFIAKLPDVLLVMIPVMLVGDVVVEERLRLLPVMVMAVPDVVMPVTVGAAEVMVTEFPLINPVLVKEQVIPTVEPECVPLILMVLLLMFLLLATGLVGPPRLEIPVAEVVPARPVNVIMLLEMVSATSDGVPVVDWNVIEPVVATRSTFMVFPLIFTRAVTVASWKTPIRAPVLRTVEPVVFKVLPTTFAVAWIALALIYVMAPEP